jgi:hypothetical protein
MERLESMMDAKVERTLHEDAAARPRGHIEIGCLLFRLDDLVAVALEQC